MARGESGSQATWRRRRPMPTAASMAEGSRPDSIPTTATDAPSTANSSVSAAANAAMPAALCAPSTSSSGRRPSTSRRPGTRTAASPSSTTSVIERIPEEGLDRRQRDRGVEALVGTVQRDQDVLVAAARGPQRDQAPAHRHLVGLAPEVTPGHPHRGGPDLARPASMMSASSGAGLPHHHPAPGLNDARLVGSRSPRAWVRGRRCGRS
jgi:hypothetical protein